MKIATCVYIINENKVLMAKKGRVVGVGKYFGYGGKIEPGETPTRCTVRETEDESGKKIGLPYISIQEEDLQPRALVTFYKGADSKEPFFQVLFYVCYKHTGLASSTDEMQEPDWFSIDDLPKYQMKDGDLLFIDRILNGETVTGWLRFSDDGTEKLIDYFFQTAKTKDLVI